MNITLIDYSLAKMTTECQLLTTSTILLVTKGEANGDSQS